MNLVWRSASEGITVSVDMTVTLFNKEQFAENRSVRWEVLPEIHINIALCQRLCDCAVLADATFDKSYIYIALRLEYITSVCHVSGLTRRSAQPSDLTTCKMDAQILSREALQAAHDWPR